MKLSGLALLVASSLCTNLAQAATRPHYGGTLHVAVRAAPVSLDPADSRQGDSTAVTNIFRLLFDTLVTLDDRGNPRPALAESWQGDPGGQHWRFVLRRGVTFQDGSPLNSEVVVSTLRAGSPAWKAFPTGDGVVVELDSPDPKFLAKLSLSRFSMVHRSSGKLSGTGPFVVTRFDPGKKLVLTARDDYWNGRAFLDAVEIDLGQNSRDQLMALDLGKLQVAEIPSEQARRAATGNRSITTSSPIELVALVFSSVQQAEAEAGLRDALALSIDRTLICNALLQGGGEPSGGLLPNWMTGYGFLFPRDPDLARARQVVRDANLKNPPAWSLGYDTSDPMARLIAERITLNAHDAGLNVRLATDNSADIRLLRIPLVSMDPQIALGSLAAAVGLPAPQFNGDAIEAMYSAERTLLQSRRVIPLLHLRLAYGTSLTVRDWAEGPDGSWSLPDVWLGAGKP